MEFRINITHDTVSMTPIQPNIESTIRYCPFSFYYGGGAYSHYDRLIFSTVIFLSFNGVFLPQKFRQRICCQSASSLLPICFLIYIMTATCLHLK
jgi:hypothetical protein